MTVALTCSAVAYNQTTLQATVTQLLRSQEVQQLGTGYLLLGNVAVTVARVTVTPPSIHTRVLLAFSSTGTWVYALTPSVQEQIRTLVAGKTKQAALQLLQALPGVQGATITLQGTSERLPQDQHSIHLLVVQGGS